MRFTRQTFAKGKTGRKVGMNKTETEYNSELDIQKRAGLIEWFMFEGVKLRLADMPPGHACWPTRTIGGDPAPTPNGQARRRERRHRRA